MSGYRIIDLSRTLQEGMPESSALPRFAAWWYARHEWGDPVSFQSLLISEHTGTNVDAPRHVLPDGVSVDRLALETFLGPAVVLRLNYMPDSATIGRADLEAAEAAGPAIEPGDIILIHTGYDDRHWQLRPRAYEHLKNRPALTLEAAEYLAAKRVKMVGVDTTSPDVSGSPLPVHRYLLERGILIVEGLTGLEQIPLGRFVFVALPLKIHGGSGSPVRAAAIVGNPSALLGGETGS